MTSFVSWDRNEEGKAPRCQQSAVVSNVEGADGFVFFQHHKLRHIKGISVRNLVVSRYMHTRRRLKAVEDDEAIGIRKSDEASKMPNREPPSLHHSRSFGDLKTLSKSHTTSSITSSDSHPAAQTLSPGLSPLKIETSRNRGAFSPSSSISPITPTTPHGPTGVRKRRGTLPWLNVNPTIRQSRLEDVAENLLANTWFSIHCANIDEPVYISEVIEKVMNPDFQFFNLRGCGPAVSRSDELTVKLWTKTGTMPEYALLLELFLNLRSLVYIGKSLDCLEKSLPPNTMIFHFEEGVYVPRMTRH